MATLYCEPALYTYAATPTWGTAQDGNGKAKGAATPATASIVFSGVPSSGTITVCGVSVSPSWATSADNCANLLATAINAATGNVTTTGWRSSAVQLRNAVYARGPANGAASGTCEIMTRQGGADFNSQNAFVFTLNNVSSSSPRTFSGGANGAWGWLWNEASIWASSVSAGGYGVLAAALPYAGAIAAGDVIHVRANNVSISIFSSGGTMAPAAIGSQSAPVRIVVGDTTEWSGDSADSTLKYTSSMSGGSQWQFNLATNTYVSIDGGRKSSDGSPRFIFEVTGSATTGLVWIGCGGTQQVRISDFKIDAGVANASLNPNSGHAGGSGIELERVIFKSSRSSSNFFGGGSSFYARLKDCVFDATGTVSAWTAMLNDGNNTGGLLLLDACTFTGFVAGSVFRTNSGTGSSLQVVLNNCDLGTVTNFRSQFGVNPSSDYNPYRRYTAINNQRGSRDFVIDTPFGYVEWMEARTYPTLNATLYDGSSTPWVWRVGPPTTTGYIGQNFPFICPRIGKENTGDEVEKDITLEFAIEQNLSWDKSHFGFEVHYLDDTGTLRVENTYNPSGGAFTTSAVTWSSESGGQVVFDDGGGNIFFNKRKITLTTQYPVAADSEVGVYPWLRNNAANSSRFLFVDPDVTMADA